MIAVVGRPGIQAARLSKNSSSWVAILRRAQPWAWKTCQRPLRLRAGVSVHNDKIRDRVRLSHGPKREFGGVTINSPLSLPSGSRRCQSM